MLSDTVNNDLCSLVDDSFLQVPIAHGSYQVRDVGAKRKIPVSVRVSEEQLDFQMGLPLIYLRFGRTKMCQGFDRPLKVKF